MRIFEIARSIQAKNKEIKIRIGEKEEVVRGKQQY